MIEVSLGTLELTDHQKAMLAPPEERIAALQFPKSIADRVAKHR